MTRNPDMIRVDKKGRVAESVDALDLKSNGHLCPRGFKSPLAYFFLLRSLS